MLVHLHKMYCRFLVKLHVVIIQVHDWGSFTIAKRLTISRRFDEAVDWNPLYRHIPLILFLLTHCLSFQFLSYIRHIFTHHHPLQAAICTQMCLCTPEMGWLAYKKHHQCELQVMNTMSVSCICTSWWHKKGPSVQLAENYENLWH